MERSRNLAFILLLVVAFAARHEQLEALSDPEDELTYFAGLFDCEYSYWDEEQHTASVFCGGFEEPSCYWAYGASFCVNWWYSCATICNGVGEPNYICVDTGDPCMAGCQCILPG